MGVIDIKSQDEYDQLIRSDKPSVVLFSVNWSEECKHIFDVMNELLGEDDLKNVQFIRIGAEDFPEISMKHEIVAAPTTIFFKQGSATDRVDGVDIAAFTSKCKKLAGASSAGGSLEDRLKALINQAKVMVFMKGDPSTPRCGFSKQLVAIFNETGIAYKTFDILADEDVRQGLKTYSDWPTYPQVYVNGELIGGLDIIKELQSSGELIPTLKG